MKPADFFKLYAPAAISSIRGTGLCASVTLAQAALESNWGESYLTKKGFNFGGIKAGTKWEGKVLVLPTREVVNGKSVVVQAAFRCYESATDYFLQRVVFLKSLSRYKRLFQADDCVAEAHLFQLCGYATDPAYGSKLVSIIRKYNLTTYDA